MEVILKNKWEFIKKYLEVNKITSVKEKAKMFAINAYREQNSKNELEEVGIMRFISEETLLEEYGVDELIVAAGYLYDVVENTKYSIEDIKEEFGDDVVKLVMNKLGLEEKVCSVKKLKKFDG